MQRSSKRLLLRYSGIVADCRVAFTFLEKIRSMERFTPTAVNQARGGLSTTTCKWRIIDLLENQQFATDSLPNHSERLGFFAPRTEQQSFRTLSRFLRATDGNMDKRKGTERLGARSPVAPPGATSCSSPSSRLLPNHIAC
jgi:hypothetical protein